MIINVNYGIGFGDHDTELDLPDDLDEELIEQEVSDYVRERVWWSWEREEEE